MSGELLHRIRPGIMSARRDQNIQDFANIVSDTAAQVVNFAVAAFVVQGKQKRVDNIINVDKVAEAIERTCHLDRNSSVNVSEIDAEHALLHIRHILSRTVNVEHSKRSRLQAERHVQLKVLLPRKLRNTIEGNWCGHVGFFHRKCFGISINTHRASIEHTLRVVVDAPAGEKQGAQGIRIEVAFGFFMRDPRGRLRSQVQHRVERSLQFLESVGTRNITRYDYSFGRRR